MRKMKTKSIVTVLSVTFYMVMAFYFFLVPMGMIIHDLTDPGVQENKLPYITARWHKHLSEEIHVWANDRVDSEKGAKLQIDDVSGTEWPMFSAVFYLWATEALQSEWENGAIDLDTEPKIYARQSIEASIKLILDPSNASWVIRHWGDDYLEKENLFYRMLLIAGLTSYQKLVGENQYTGFLYEQVQSLASELDSSPFGLIDDYPGECYPVDILPAIAVIHRAGKLLGLDTTPFVERSVRAFEGARLDPKTGLPAYVADPETGLGIGPARGVGMSYMLIWAPELWPEKAKSWYRQYESHFWSEGSWVSGFREFSKYSDSIESFSDVDSGPVIDGFGVAASAFGLAAARVNKKPRQSLVLSAEALVFSWPLPNGTLLVPRLLSNLIDAPYLGESALLFIMTRTALFEDDTGEKAKIPTVVYLALLFYGFVGCDLLFIGWAQLKRNF
ncbi:hypothetical protein [Teredinibacter sp. KSP-S5-2]|uniref:hypothetical protein n=1 Tax=Teredinibacter sp. KSP-S5-2 TaxID=3034506 RepID=UPI002934936C|nr:hypothetical protein [Teredinibacter sp. KSP-S5-2]WNO09422.1 hypothetical protein P5V12_20995 [Teredinibacter sp. KSP-S5-2]